MIIDSVETDDLTQQINAFIEGKSVIDIKYSSGSDVVDFNGTGVQYWCEALIMYEDE